MIRHGQYRKSSARQWLEAANVNNICYFFWREIIGMLMHAGLRHRVVEVSVLWCMVWWWWWS